MNISNLNELLNTQIINEGLVSSVKGFALELQELKPGYAFFSNNEEDINIALKQGAFVIVYEKELPIKDKEVFYLKSENLENALLRLLRFLCEEKELCFLCLDEQSLNFSKAFFLKNLQGNVYLDFKLLNQAKQKEILCFNKETYLLKLTAYYEKLCCSSFEFTNRSSLFFTSLLCENSYFKNLRFPFLYAEIFANFVAFFKKKKANFHFDFNKLDSFELYFVNENIECIEFGKSSKAFIIVFKESDFEFWQEKCKHIKGFKTAVKNSLFCDFSYNELKDLKYFKDFRYCLVLADNKEEFRSSLMQTKEKNHSLFDE